MEYNLSTIRFRLGQAMRTRALPSKYIFAAIGLLVSCLFAEPLLARSAVISMKSGERLIGEVSEKSDPSTVRLHSALLGEIRLPRDQIESIVFEEEEVLTVSLEVPEKEQEPKAEVEEGKVTDNESESFLARFVYNPEVLEAISTFKAPDDWRGNLRIGMNLSTGDQQWTETFVRGNVQIDPKESPNFYRLNGSYVYRETERPNGETVVSTDRYDANFTYRRDFTDRWFLQNLMSWRVDQIRGIDRELQELIGLGVRFKPTDNFNFLFGAAGGIEELVADFEDNRSGTHEVANFFQEANWKPFEKASFVQAFNYFANPNDSERFSYILTAAFRYRVTDLLGLEFSFNQNFDNDVGNGNEREDKRWQNAIVVYF